jgi:acetyl esterase/lipase
MVLYRWGIAGVLGLFSLLAVNSAYGQRKEDFTSYFRIGDVPYTEDKSAKANKLDVYMPKKGSRSPVIIYVHGGNWNSGDKKEVDTKPEYFTSLGYIFVSVNYRLAPSASNDEQVNDVARSIVWLYQNLIHYSGDKDKMFLMGSGTGAQLVSLIGTRQDILDKNKGSTHMIKGIISVEGLGFNIPLVLSSEGNRFREGCFASVGDEPKQWKSASPVNHITSHSYIPPIMLTYSGTKSVSESDSRSFAGKLTENKVPVKLKGYSGRASVDRDLGKVGDAFSEDLMVFLNNCLVTVKASE